MNFTETTYTKIKYIMRRFLRIRRLSFFVQAKTKRKPSRRNSGRFMLNLSKEWLCIYISFQESRDSIKEEPKTKVYDMFLSYWPRL